MFSFSSGLEPGWNFTKLIFFAKADLSEIKENNILGKYAHPGVDHVDKGVEGSKMLQITSLFNNKIME